MTLGWSEPGDLGSCLILGYALYIDDGSTGVAADILNGIICYLIGIICYLGRVTTVTRCSSSASTRGKPSGELGSSARV